ncbi:hypothetical protein Tco_0083488 [Tanacetum coccineum]
MIRLRAETPSTSHPLPLPTSSPPLQLLSSNHRTERPEITLPPRKRLGIDLGPRYKIGESSAIAATRPVGGRRADYGFVGTMDIEIRRRRAKEVIELTAVQEQDTQDIYAVIEDTQDRQTHIYQSVRTLVDDSQYHYETARLLEILELRSVEMGQQAVISQLQTTDRKSQTQMAEFQRQLGPAKGPAQPDAPGSVFTNMIPASRIIYQELICKVRLNISIANKLPETAAPVLTFFLFARILRYKEAVPLPNAHNVAVGPSATIRAFHQIVDFLQRRFLKNIVRVQPACFGVDNFQTAFEVQPSVALSDVFPGLGLYKYQSNPRLLKDNSYEQLPVIEKFRPVKFLIHTILQCLSAKTTAWNEFSSTMASAIIYLATNQKFNFSKYIFESMVKNLENVFGKFLMYPRFVQVFFEKQLKGMSNHRRIYVTPSHTKKIFGNMRRLEKGFSGRETPLFPTMMVQAQEEMGEGSANPTNPHHTPTIIQPSTSQPQKKQKPRKPKRKDTEVPQPSGPTNNVADEAVYEETNDNLERAATTATSLDVEQDMGNINKTQSKATLNEPSSLGTSSGSSPRGQEIMGDTIAQNVFENVSKLLNDPLLTRGNTLRSGEDSLKLKELMELCTNLQNRVIDLEKTKTSQAQEITSLKRRVKRLENKGGSKTHGLKRLYKVGLSRRVESFEDEGLGVEDASKQERIAHIDADAETYVDEVTLPQALAALKSVKPKADKVMLQEPEQGTITTTTAATTVTAASIRPKAKGLVIHKQEEAPTPTVSS